MFPWRQALQAMIQHSQATDAAAPSPAPMDPQLAIPGKSLDHPSVDPTVRLKNTSFLEMKSPCDYYFKPSRRFFRVQFIYHGPGQCLLPHAGFPLPAASAKPNQGRHPQSQGLESRGLEGFISATGGKTNNTNCNIIRQGIHDAL